MIRVQGNDKISGFGFCFPREKQQKTQKQIRRLKEDHGGGNGQGRVVQWQERLGNGGALICATNSVTLLL